MMLNARSHTALSGDAAAVLRILALNGVAAVLGMIVLTALFRLGFGQSMAILFYRGLVLCVLTAVTIGLMIAVLGRRTGLGNVAEATSAALFSLGVNIVVLVLFPVTIERSISVFMLGYMDAQKSRALSATDIETAFRDVYVRDLKQIPRRLDEQLATGNVATENGLLRLTPQGQNYVRLSRTVADWFGTNRDFVTQERKP